MKSLKFLVHSYFYEFEKNHGIIIIFTNRLEALLKLPQTELAQRLVTATLQLEERSCCIALLQESLANHKEQVRKKLLFKV